MEGPVLVCLLSDPCTHVSEIRLRKPFDLVVSIFLQRLMRRFWSFSDPPEPKQGGVNHRWIICGEVPNHVNHWPNFMTISIDWSSGAEMPEAGIKVYRFRYSEGDANQASLIIYDSNCILPRHKMQV